MFKGVFSNHVDGFNTVTKNISSVAILNFIQIRQCSSIFFHSNHYPENIGVDTRIVTLF